MFITKKHLSRRTFLRAGSATIGLPLLSAMVPAATALAQTAAAPKPRLGFFYLPHGAIMANTLHGAEMNRWTPDKVGRDFDLKKILEPFAPHQKYLTVFSGLGNRTAESPSVHAIFPGTWLTCVAPPRSQTPNGGISIDQIAARHIGQETPLPSLELATEERGGSGGCDGTYGCSYSRTISFRTPTTPLPMEADPGKVFEKIFGRGTTDAERGAIAADFSSVLDLVTTEIKDLERGLGAEDRVMVNDYLDSVRELERRIQLLSARDLSNVDLPEIPVASPAFDERIKLMFDLLVAAYQTNSTRIATFMMAAEVSNMSYAHIGVPDAFHPLSHHADNKNSLEKLAQVQRYHSQVFADFLGKLAAIPDGDAGSLLDSSIFLYGSNMSNSNKHDSFPLPTLVVGGANGKIKGNQHLRVADRTPIANLHYTLMLRAGVPVDKVGDSTGEIAEV
ncbi:MAG TPA: DUF1552 domain-containing protein [Gammaproteobacteria bacterium]|nr:DUF1552 domain-containing protein [Gammaproteobacteria bacterium]